VQRPAGKKSKSSFRGEGSEKTVIFIYKYVYLYYFGIEMESKNITLRVNADLYDKYREFCKKKGLLISRQVEIMMENKLSRDKSLKVKNG
jgi:hypothetical protein